MREAELKRLIVEEFLQGLADPRVERTRRHSLENILVISLLAVIAGADSFVAIEKFGRLKKDWLTSFLDLDDIPSHDTIGRVFAALEPGALGEAFSRWTLAIRATSKEKLIAIDGKTLRRSFREAADKAFVHMVSAWSSANHIVLGQVKTDDKSNEITAIPQLLDLLEINGALVTIDAAGTQTAIAEKILEKGGDYLLAVKGNQPSLHTAVIEHLTGRGAGLQLFDFAETQEKGHGRQEVRRAWVSSDIAGIELAAGHRWEGLSLVARVETSRTINGKTSTEDRYFICSRPNMTATEVLGAVRNHWSIENGLHWVLDVAFREATAECEQGTLPPTSVPSGSSLWDFSNNERR